VLDAGVPQIVAGPNDQRFEPDIQLFEAMERDSPSAKGGIVFVGSSSFTRWTTLVADMAPLPVLNRGFGGSGIHQQSYFAPRILFPLQPRLIVFYCGENDIANDNSSHKQVLDEFQDFVALCREHLPHTRIIYVAMKPSPLRWQWWPKFQEGNKLVRRYAEEERNLRFIDLSPGMLDSTLHPHRHIWMSDSLHMNEAGYKVWVDLLKPYLAQEWAEVQGQ
jgi:lysophospholipase L1-like esterase